MARNKGGLTVRQKEVLTQLQYGMQLNWTHTGSHGGKHNDTWVKKDDQYVERINAGILARLHKQKLISQHSKTHYSITYVINDKGREALHGKN